MSTDQSTQSIPLTVLPNESERTSGVTIEPGKRYGFFTDTTLCIGCKACEVACKEWNQLDFDTDAPLTGMSYDNTKHLGATTWRHVAFIEKISGDDGERATEMKPFQSNWLMMSDVCKHCENAPCLEACPTGALVYTEFDTVVVQEEVCNGCGYCVPACPFGVVALHAREGYAQKCTLCYDRMHGGLEPACAKVCPTDSIQFGIVEELVERAEQRVEKLQALGVESAYLYGTPDAPGATGDLGHLNAFFLLTEAPEVYNLPSAPTRGSRRVRPSLLAGAAMMAGFIGAAIAIFAGED